ncbi:MAG: threonine/serine exporter [Hungatella sp.]|jgi:uncharacterized membrane protein YjjB (DUF3815 family)|nr:threonine/serine exporter [Hungatella sp.]
MIGQFIAAVAGTVGFSVLYSVPRAYYPYCGFIGGAGWLLYCLLIPTCSGPESAFFAAALVVVLSRFFAVKERCPVTIFLISGIFPLVPGGGIYWTAYYIVTDEVEQAARTGFSAVKVAVAIVLAIVLVFQVPQKVFKR